MRRPSRSTGRSPYYGWILMVVLGLTTIISYGTTQYLFGVLVLPLSTSLHWERASLSGAFSCGLIISGLLGVPVGYLADRWGARLLMTLGSAVGGLSLIGLSFVQAISQFYLWWALGIGLATALTFYPLSFTVVANWFEHKRGSALAVLTLMGGFASPLFIPSEGWMVQHLGWRSMLLILGLLHLLIAMPLHGLLLRRHPEDLGLLPDGQTSQQYAPSDLPTDKKSIPGMLLSEAIHVPAFWLLTGSLSLVMLDSAVVQVHQIPALIARGYDPVLAATVAGGLGLASLPGRVFINLISERVTPQTLLWGSVLAQATGMVLLILAPSPGWLIPYVLLYGAAYGAISPLYASVMAEHVGRRAYGSILALQGIFVAFCSGLGPLAAGWLYDQLHNYTLAFWLCVGVLLLAALGIVFTPQPAIALKKQQPTPIPFPENATETHR
ncbi:MFS transporter [Ktedonobacter sp. SOSP1-52]|uniref:MFS transporter n=1 Tax=Ktedonobacter sp. SOSP1-52 TaxID=2778366 RepID=UPI0019168F04|nr:MFS transporter [Ktedonobacter sp. SOSP1-52]GHO63635.1 MFS transporter [Ktedonobacter sp. SOSP1-52]